MPKEKSFYRKFNNNNDIFIKKNNIIAKIMPEKLERYFKVDVSNFCFMILIKCRWFFFFLSKENGKFKFQNI